MTFTVAEVSPDIDEAALEGQPDGFYLKSVALNGQDVIETGIDLTQGAPRVPVKLVVATDGGQIDGTVVNVSGDKLANAIVGLIPDKGRGAITSALRIASTARNGHFTFKGVPPGGVHDLCV
jgi:hypothetical protein